MNDKKILIALFIFVVFGGLKVLPSGLPNIPTAAVKGGGAAAGAAGSGSGPGAAAAVSFIDPAAEAFLFPLVFGGFEGRTLSEDVRTVLYNEEGDAIILTLKEVKRGKRWFNVACGSCHVGGLTKTNPNVGLDIASLNCATPPRNNISNLVNFLYSPKSYDGFQSIAETHPSIESCDLFPKMRTLTREDLVAISGHILLQTKILNERWGGGKIYY